MGFLARIVGGGAVLHVSNFFNCSIVFLTANKTPAFFHFKLQIDLIVLVKYVDLPSHIQERKFTTNNKICISNG